MFLYYLLGYIVLVPIIGLIINRKWVFLARWELDVNNPVGSLLHFAFFMLVWPIIPLIIVLFIGPAKLFEACGGIAAKNGPLGAKTAP